MARRSSLASHGALSLETYRLLEDGAAGPAVVNAFGSLAAGLAALYLGVVLGRSRAAGLKRRAPAADAPRVEIEVQTDLSEALADLELLVFGSSCDDEALVRKFLAADAAFNTHVVARLAREPVVLH